MARKQNSKFFTLAISHELQKAMQDSRLHHGTNWGFVLRSAIEDYLSRINKQNTTA